MRERDGNTVTEMLEKPGSTVIDAREVGSGENALQIVIARQDLAWLGFLLSKGANANQQDDSGNSPMMQAVEAGFTEGVRRLLSARANVNLPNRSGETPLIRAVQKRDVAMVRLLLANGADADRRDVIAGLSARDYAKADTRTPAILKLIEEGKKAARAEGPELSRPGPLIQRQHRGFGIDRIEQPPRGAAGEGECLALARSGAIAVARRIAQDRRIIAIGHDQPGAFGQHARANRTGRSRNRRARPSRTCRNAGDNRAIWRRRADRRATP